MGTHTAVRAEHGLDVRGAVALPSHRCAHQTLVAQVRIGGATHQFRFAWIYGSPLPIIASFSASKPMMYCDRLFHGLPSVECSWLRMCVSRLSNRDVTFAHS
jgi:hypothetical protein